MGRVMARTDRQRGARCAREARAALGLDPGAPLPCLLTAVENGAGLPVVVAGLPTDVAGACYRAGDAAVLWVNGTQWPPRQRFTLAHELGHAWCGHDGRLEVDTVATLNGHTTTPVEIAANAFAAEFLVPRAGMKELVAGDPTLEEVVVISAHYGVSAIAVVYRVKQLRLASPARVEQLEAEVAEGLHHEVFRALDLQPLGDRLGDIRHLPYLSPALDGTALGAALLGDDAGDPAVARAVRRLLA
jgi:Zn-dependent peptidase ImmA (M78 family)